MPMSSEALEGIKAAVAWNPEAARYLLGILREAPTWVKRKPDPYGPLHLILCAGPHERLIAPGVTVMATPPPFPEDKRPMFEAFGAEWRARRISKQELADTVERLLAGLGAGDVQGEESRRPSLPTSVQPLTVYRRE